MKKKFIALCVPTLGQVTARWASHMMDLIQPMNVGRCRIMVHGKPVAEARNECVQRALDMEASDREVTHLFWIDDDVLASATALVKLYYHHRDIVSGVYFTKEEIAQPLIFPGKTAGTCPYVPDALMEVWAHGMGLTLVRTDVYRRMKDELKLGTDAYGHTAWYETPGPQFEGNILNAGGTEDLFFCDRAVIMGYKPLVDCTSHAFGWHIDRHTQRVYPEAQFKQILKGEEAVWQTPDGPRKWAEG